MAFFLIIVLSQTLLWKAMLYSNFKQDVTYLECRSGIFCMFLF